MQHLLCGCCFNNHSRKHNNGGYKMKNNYIVMWFEWREDGESCGWKECGVMNECVYVCICLHCFGT